MITGSNTDVEYGGRTYHVQTEDRGRDNPIVESLVYCQGEILGAQRYDYREKISSGFDESLVATLLERQHKRVIREVRNGLWSEEGPRLVGDELLTDRSFDAVVSEFLESDEELERVNLAVVGRPTLCTGQATRLRVRVFLEGDKKRPAPSSPLAIRAVGPGTAPVVLAEGETDAKGIFECELTPPETESGPGALIVVSGVAGGGLLRIPVKKPS